MKKISAITRVKGEGVAFWYFSITPQKNSRAVVKNLRILVCRYTPSLTITHLQVNCHITPPGGESISEH